MKQSTVYDWGQTPNLAPSIKRASPLSWVAASAFFGAVCALAAMALVWRPVAWLQAPPGPLMEHLSYGSKLIFHAMFNTFYAAESRDYLSWLSRRTDGERVALIWRGMLGVWCFLLPWALFAKSYLDGRDGLIHLRGSTRLEGAAAVAQIKRSLAKRVKRRPDHEIAPGVPYPADLWTRHVLVVGGVGSGKSTAIKPLIDKIVVAGEQMFLFDPKSEFTSGFGGPQLIAPWDARSLSWDIARDMRNMLDMRRFAATMIRESQDPMWSNASRQLLVGLMIYLKGTRGVDWGWLELKDMISLPQSKLLEIMKRWHPEAERAVEKASVTTAGILINLASFCSSIFDLAEAWGAVPSDRRVSFVDWIQGRSPFKQLILQGHGAYGELTKSYVEGIVGVVSAMVNSVEMTDDPNRKIWFIADEFAMMGKIPVRPLFEVGRSRGVRCVVACQDLAQLEDIYGASMVRALVGMCGTLLVGQIMQGETAEQLCKAFGAREVERANMSSSSNGSSSAGSGGSTTLSFNRDEVPLYKPSELTSRLGLSDDGAGVVLLLFTGGQAYELKWPLYEMRHERSPHVPAPWTLGCLDGFSASFTPMASAKAVKSEPRSQPGAFDSLFEEMGTLAEAGNAKISVAGVNETARAKDVNHASSVSANAILEDVGVDGEARAAVEEAMRLQGDGAVARQVNGSGHGEAIGEGAFECGHGDNLEGVNGGASGFQSRFDSTSGLPLKGKSHSAADRGESLNEATPKEAVVVQVAADARATAMGPEPDPAFDAMAELAVVKLGLDSMSLAVEIAAALDASSVTSPGPQHRVHMGVKPRTGTGSAMGRTAP